MKLMKKNINPKCCKAKTKSGSQCSRTPFKKGYCKQHYKLVKSSDSAALLPDELLLNEIPEPPVVLGNRGMAAWTMYCQRLIDEQRMYNTYLYGLADLCALEDELDQVKDDLKTHGYVNIYDTAIQRNGYAAHYDRILGHIRSLRADYRLTDASAAKAISQKKEQNPYDAQKTKTW
jgi:phage terminase small subunit